MRERIVKVGRPSPLTCIVSEPEKLDAGKPAVIILNSGIMHHIGTCRLSVKIARSLTDQGFLSLRMDFSGLGDSEPRTGTQSFTESAPKEVKEVMDFMQKTKGIDTFILYGLCSGADASYETAIVDDRVVAMCQIDSYCYRTLGYYLRLPTQYYAPRFIDKNAWIRLANKAKDKLFGNRDGSQEGDEFIEMPSYVRVFPDRKEIATGLSRLIDRNVQMYNIFTGDMADVVNHKQQYRNCFSDLDFKDTLKLDYISDCSHIVAEPKNQRFIVDNITQWAIKICNGNDQMSEAA